MSLKKFNTIVQEEISKARKYEDNELWTKARDTWLDIIEYCLLFAKKTPDLKTSTARMIIDKAQKLMSRVDQIDEKIRIEGIAIDDIANEKDPVDIIPTGEDFDGLKPFNISREDIAPLHEQLRSAMAENQEDAEESEKNQDEDTSKKKYIELGDERIEIPDDFPLIDITPKDSFKPAKIPPEKMPIDSTIHPINGENQETDGVNEGKENYEERGENFEDGDNS